MLDTGSSILLKTMRNNDFVSSSLESVLCGLLGRKLFGLFFLCVLGDYLLLDIGRNYFIMAQ
jgi:hypothetical protein